MKMNSLQDLLIEIRNNILPKEDNLVTFVLDEKVCFIEVFEIGVHIIIKYEDVYDTFFGAKTKTVTASLYAELNQNDLTSIYLKDVAAICDLVEENAHIFETLLAPIDKK